MIWIVGTGLMGIEYAKVLQALNKEFIAIGRGEENCLAFGQKYAVRITRGGLREFLKTKPQVPEAVIVGVGIEALTETTIDLLNYGIKKILLEKPGLGYPSEIAAVSQLTTKQEADVLLAYNRRFYSSVLKAKEIIKEDGGVVSFNFEFTEWSHEIKNLRKHITAFHNWFLGNSTHVIDTAFYLGGKPKELAAFFKGGLDWHPASSVFAGAGVSVSNALFSYHANWEGPGRWVVELITPVHRLIFKPMETLQIQEIGSIVVNHVDIDDKLDKDFKPGFYLQTQAFLNNNFNEFCTIEEQRKNIEKYYTKMSGYTLTN